jgi:anti-sigma B factor antagonist
VTRFNVTLRVDENSRLGILVLSGDLDYAEAGRVVDTARAGLEDDAVRRLVLDLRGLEFIDSSGVGALVNVHRLAEATGCPVALRNVGPGTAAVLKIAAIDRIFGHEPSED